MKRCLLVLILSLCILGVNAQQNISLRIHHLLGPTPFQLGLAAVNNIGSAFKVSRLQYYISEIELIHDGGQVTLVDSTWILANAGQTTVQALGSHNVTALEGVRFGIGVQNAFNHLDPTQWSMGHPLAPQSPSMHWGWSSGYRFVAMEGTAGTGFNQPYEIHALEDGNYFKTTVMTSGNMSGSELMIDLDADYTQAVKNIDVASGPISHGGTGLSVTLLENFRDFVFSASTATVAVEPSSGSAGWSIFPNPSSGHATIQLDSKVIGQSTLIVHDAMGRTLKTLEVDASGRAALDLDAPGVFYVELRQNGQSVATQRLVIAR